MSKFGSTLSVIWLWIKHNWLLFVMAAGGIFLLFFLRQKSSQVEETMKLYQRQADNYKKQIDDIRAVQEQERVKRAEIEKTFQDTLTIIRRDYQEQLSQLNKQKKEELKNIITETHGDPDIMAERINSLFGIPIYHKTEGK